MSNFSDKKVLIGVPSYSGFIPTMTVQSLLQLHKPCSCAFLTIERQRIDKARNFMALETVNHDFDYLMMIDDDNPVPVDALSVLLEDNKDVVIAPILTRRPDEHGKYNLCAYYSEVIKIKENNLRKYNFIDTFKEIGPLHQVDAGGTGCILIKQIVIKTLFEKYQDGIFEFGDITVDGQRRTMSEDVEFCERAHDAGFEIWLDDRIRPLHITNTNINQWHMT